MRKIRKSNTDIPEMPRMKRELIKGKKIEKGKIVAIKRFNYLLKTILEGQIVDIKRPILLLETILQETIEGRRTSVDSNAYVKR